MPKKVKKGKEAGSMDFATFMKNMRKNDAFIDLSRKEEHFYRFGDFKLDRALGGGLPAGQIYSFQGASGSGKTLAALQISQKVLDEGKRVMYFDVENKISTKALAKFNLLEQENFVIFSVETLEDALEQMMAAIESDLFGLIVIDSTDALVTDEQNDRDIHEGSKVGGYKAKMFSEWLGKVSQLAAAHECSIALIQQIRDKLDSYGNPITTSGGKAIEFYSTTILRFAKNKNDNEVEDGRITYQGAKITIMKMNQGALPAVPIEIRFYIGDQGDWGIDKYTSTFEEAKRLGILAPPTATSHRYVPSPDLLAMLDAEESELTFNGRPATMKALMTDSALFDAVCQLVDEYDEKTVETPASDVPENEVLVDFEEDDDE